MLFYTKLSLITESENLQSSIFRFAIIDTVEWSGQSRSLQEVITLGGEKKHEPDKSTATNRHRLPTL